MQPILKRTTSGTSEHPLPLIMEYHINRVDVSRLLNDIYHTLQEQSNRDQSLYYYYYGIATDSPVTLLKLAISTVNIPRYTDWRSNGCSSLQINKNK